MSNWNPQLKQLEQRVSRGRECNVVATWGQMATGGGYSKLNETMTTLGVPCMSQKNFINTERQFGEWWKDKLHESMIKVARNVS